MNNISEIVVPAPGRILVKIENERATKARNVLYLPPGSSVDNTKPTQGLVVAVNPDDEYLVHDEEGNDRVERLYNVGDTVIFGKFTGTTIKLGEDQYILLRESDVLARILTSVKVEVR